MVYEVRSCGDSYIEVCSDTVTHRYGQATGICNAVTQSTYVLCELYLCKPMTMPNIL